MALTTEKLLFRPSQSITPRVGAVPTIFIQSECGPSAVNYREISPDRVPSEEFLIPPVWLMRSPTDEELELEREFEEQEPLWERQYHISVQQRRMAERMQRKRKAPPKPINARTPPPSARGASNSPAGNATPRTPTKRDDSPVSHGRRMKVAPRTHPASGNGTKLPPTGRSSPFSNRADSGMRNATGTGRNSSSRMPSVESVTQGTRSPSTSETNPSQLSINNNPSQGSKGTVSEPGSLGYAGKTPAGSNQQKLKPAAKDGFSVLRGGSASASASAASPSPSLGTHHKNKTNGATPSPHVTKPPRPERKQQQNDAGDLAVERASSKPSAVFDGSEAVDQPTTDVLVCSSGESFQRSNAIEVKAGLPPDPTLHSDPHSGGSAGPSHPSRASTGRKRRDVDDEDEPTTLDGQEDFDPIEPDDVCRPSVVILREKTERTLSTASGTGTGKRSAKATDSSDAIAVRDRRSKSSEGAWSARQRFGGVDSAGNVVAAIPLPLTTSLSSTLTRPAGRRYEPIPQRGSIPRDNDEKPGDGCSHSDASLLPGVNQDVAAATGGGVQRNPSELSGMTPSPTLRTNSLPTRGSRAILPQNRTSLTSAVGNRNPSPDAIPSGLLPPFQEYSPRVCLESSRSAQAPSVAGSLHRAPSPPLSASNRIDANSDVVSSSQAPERPLSPPQTEAFSPGDPLHSTSTGTAKVENGNGDGAGTSSSTGAHKDGIKSPRPPCASESVMDTEETVSQTTGVLNNPEVESVSCTQPVTMDPVGMSKEGAASRLPLVPPPSSTHAQKTEPYGSVSSKEASPIPAHGDEHQNPNHGASVTTQPGSKKGTASYTRRTEPVSGNQPEAISQTPSIQRSEGPSSVERHRVSTLRTSGSEEDANKTQRCCVVM